MTASLPDVAASVAGRAGVLGDALACWAARDDSKPQPDVRQAANTAMDEIDAILAELHQARAQLVTGIRQSDDAAVAQADEMLRRGGGAR